MRLIQKILNLFGYYKIEQLKSGRGMCGLCGNPIMNLIYVNTGDNWADIDICKDCLSKNEKLTRKKLTIVFNKKYSVYGDHIQGTKIFIFEIPKIFGFNWYTDCGDWFIYINLGKYYIRFSNAGFMKGKWNI